MRMNLPRIRRLIEGAIRVLDLDLRGLRILTEAATGYYTLTPLIAALSGAEQVFALTRDSQYGKASEVYKRTMMLAKRWGVADRIEVFSARDDHRIALADIVTNLGFVRPLDKGLLAQLKPTAVIPLMWETWEYRPEDLDLVECRRIGIPVLGTNEHHPNLQLFKYIGQIALKLLYNLDIEVFHSDIVVIGSDEFEQVAVSTLQAMEAKVTLLDTQGEGALKTSIAQEALRSADAIVIAEHRNRKMLIGKNGEISAVSLRALNPGVSVAHICGGVDRSSLITVGLRCSPNTFAPAGYMSVATDYLGPKPLIDLQTAGLKVGEELARVRVKGFTAQQSELQVLRKTSLAQGFDDSYSTKDS